jgi:hypothetical protein
MATGTGWPFGGPWIDETLAAAKPVLRNGRVAGEPTRMMVKRAAPGGEGLVVDPYSPDALLRYLAPFDKAFAAFPAGSSAGSSTTRSSTTKRLDGAASPEVFREMHGYDVQRFAAELTAKDPALVTTIDRDTLARVKADYRETLARLHLDFLRTWVRWSHEKGGSCATSRTARPPTCSTSTPPPTSPRPRRSAPPLSDSRAAARRRRGAPRSGRARAARHPHGLVGGARRRPS